MPKKTIATAPGEPSLHVELTGAEIAQRAQDKIKHDEGVAAYAALEYQRKRQAGYTSVENQLDMLFHDLENGTTEWRDLIRSVKAANPKPEE